MFSPHENSPLSPHITNDKTMPNQSANTVDEAHKNNDCNKISSSELNNHLNVIAGKSDAYLDDFIYFQKSILEPGDGQEARCGDIIKLNIVAFDVSGNKTLDTSANPVTYRLGVTPVGRQWHTLLTGIKPGEKRSFILKRRLNIDSSQSPPLFTDTISKRDYAYQITRTDTEQDITTSPPPSSTQLHRVLVQTSGLGPNILCGDSVDITMRQLNEDGSYINNEISRQRIVIGAHQIPYLLEQEIIKKSGGDTLFAILPTDNNSQNMFIEAKIDNPTPAVRNTSASNSIAQDNSKTTDTKPPSDTQSETDDNSLKDGPIDTK